MEQAELDKYRETALAATTSSIENHFKGLDTLKGRGLDIARLTDVLPYLASAESDYGRRELKEWLDITEALSNRPKYTVVGHYAIDRLDSGFNPQYGVIRSWLRIYKDLTIDKIGFINGEDGKATSIVINHPSVVFGSKPGETTNPVILTTNEHIYIDDTMKVEWGTEAHIGFGANVSDVHDILKRIDRQETHHKFMGSLNLGIQVSKEFNAWIKKERESEVGNVATSNVVVIGSHYTDKD